MSEQSPASPATQTKHAGTTSGQGAGDTGSIEASKTPNQFCAAEQISRSELYKEWSEGRGPDFYYIGARRRISPEAHAKYRRQREGEAKSEASKAKASRTSERARAAALAPRKDQQSTT